MTGALFALTVPSVLHAQPKIDSLAGPDSTSALLAADDQERDTVLDVNLLQSWSDWKASIKDRTGFDFGLDYIALGYVASQSLGQDTAATGVFRLFGEWELLGRSSGNTGTLLFKVDNRHRLDTVPVKDFAGELGYAGIIGPTYSDQGWRLTHLYWNQNFAGGRGAVYLGLLDVTDYTDAYALASPWQGFANLAFQTGSGTIGGLPDAALGVAVGSFLNEKIYMGGGIVDANADAANPFSDTLFDQGETFKSFEVGWTSGSKARFFNNAHLTFWQIDAREQAGTPDGYGVAFSVSQVVRERWFPFLRGGWADGGDALYEASVSAGFGYSQDPTSSIFGFGVNWSRPNEDTFGSKLDDQITVEAFMKWQLTEGIELTPSMQYIHNPAQNPEGDSIALFGLRFRAAL
ncbi:carbohydrate porin [uncultured Roseibium sp.]|uniref:carbohydrate porin n=1 Tax=uncultured Roseibium sp. TaxID=1936171 RepID=UPI00374D5601